AQWGHIHVECRVPDRGEVSHVIHVPCQYLLHHIDGAIGLSWVDLQNAGPFYIFPDGAACNHCEGDVTRGGPLPVMKGDPMGDVTFPFTLVIDPASAWVNRGVLHGWAQVQLGARVFLANGLVFNYKTRYRFWSVADPNAPEADTTCDG